MGMEVINLKPSRHQRIVELWDVGPHSDSYYGYLLMDNFGQVT